MNINTLFKLGKPILHKLDAETAHSVTIKGLKTNLAPTSRGVKSPRLKQGFCGITFENPVGLAAGFDKNAEVIAPILGLGFGFTEVGGITPNPQGGLPKPRIFRDPTHEAVINKMNFPNVGMRQFKKNVSKLPDRQPGQLRQDYELMLKKI